MKNIKTFFIFLLLLSFESHAQVYFPPTDSLAVKKLEWWQGLKFGLLIHWGTYSQWGIVESWSLCPEDEGWCQRKGPYSSNYFEYKKAYENLFKTFNPTAFEPSKWAKAAKYAGMKYVVFTTKHHDGFCMFNTQMTDYKITSADCPYSKNAKANIANEVFKAFRNEGLGTGAYFSKPDWHCPDYWDPYFPPFDRNPNYNMNKYPEKWKRYAEFTRAQIKELMSDYGKMDILWMDGGWVQPMTETSPRWGPLPVSQDINIPEIAEMARKLQSGILVVDRAVEGHYQDYLTPEQHFPDTLLPYPWETCMTMGSSWSYVPTDTYKPTRELIHMLCKIVSRGGNFLLNIGPGPDGDFAPVAYERLRELGAWMLTGGEAIYGSAPLVVSGNPHFVFTQRENKSYAIYLVDSTQLTLPVKFEINGLKGKVKQVTMLQRNKSIQFTMNENKLTIQVPEELRKIKNNDYAIIFRIDY